MTTCTCLCSTQILWLSPLPLSPSLSNPSRRAATPRRPRALPAAVVNSKEVERGVAFDTGGSFFRRESAVGRDLGVLAAAIHGRRIAASGDDCGIRVLDAMCGCGVRALRYLAQAGAGFVWANDASEDCRPLILSNLSGEPRDSPDGERRWVVTHLDANRALAESYLRKEFFDLVDVDCFGSDSSFMSSALSAIRTGGLLYVTSTDGFSSGGHRPYCSLASYGAYVRPMPYSNEIGLRMLIGGVLREAAALGYEISPLFSYYSYHGPVFRVMIRITRGQLQLNSHYNFITYCRHCGNSPIVSWEELGQISCPCRKGEVSKSIVVSGPLWTGPLHSSAYVTEMLNLASDWGWAYTGDKGNDLDKLLNQMIEESDPQLPPGYIKLDEIASRGKINSPSVSSMISTLKKEGYAAGRSHISPNAIKTNCSMNSELMQSLMFLTEWKHLDPAVEILLPMHETVQRSLHGEIVPDHVRCFWLHKMRICSISHFHNAQKQILQEAQNISPRLVYLDQSTYDYFNNPCTIG